MNCKQAQKAIALLSGNDLPDTDIERLNKHLGNCSACRKERDNLKGSHPMLVNILRSDQPEPLPSNFTYQVLENIDRAESMQAGNKSPKIYKSVYMTAAVTAVMVILIFLIGLNPLRIRRARLDAHLKAIAEMESQHVEFRWDSKLKYLDNLEGPVKLDQWQPSDKAGIVAIMHKPDPINRPETYILDYCQDSRNIRALMSYPWFDQRVNRLTIAAGSKQNIFVAFYYLPNSARIERSQIIKKLEKKYRANFPNKKGM